MILQMFMGQSLLPQQQKAPGVLGATPSEEPPEHKSFLDKLLGIYGAGNVSNEQAKNLRNQGLIEAGLAIMASSGQGKSTGEALLGGLQIGKAGTAQRLGGIEASNLQGKLQEISATNPAALPAMLQEAIVSGADPQTINALSNAVRSAAAGEAAGQGSEAAGKLTTKLMEDGSYHNVMVHPYKDEVIADYGPVRPDPGKVIGGVDEEGNAIEKLVDSRSGRTIATFEQAPEGPTAGEIDAGSRLSQFRIARENIVTNLEALGRGPTWAEWKLYNSDAPGRGVISNEMQGLLQAQNLIVTQIAKELGGVRGAASAEFRNIIARTYLIAPGDRALNQEQTLEALKKMEEDLERRAGGVFDMTRDQIDESIDSIEPDDGLPPMDDGGLTPDDF